MPAMLCGKHAQAVIDWVTSPGHRLGGVVLINTGGGVRPEYVRSAGKVWNDVVRAQVEVIRGICAGGSIFNNDSIEALNDQVVAL